jgi:hypothetical protein
LDFLLISFFGVGCTFEVIAFFVFFCTGSASSSSSLELSLDSDESSSDESSSEVDVSATTGFVIAVFAVFAYERDQLMMYEIGD